MKTIRKIELLSPAKNLECGIEAIKHGADAVYIGAPQFSARTAAPNTLDDIKTLCEYAHLFNAHVYVAINTILTNKELKDAEKLIWQLYDFAKADAVIVQDMGVLMLDLPPIALHASTQVDNRDVEKAKFLEQAGFSQIVLARELSVNQIREISDSVSVPLEVFVHGALCVSYSGQCYISQALAGRSANKGSCAQYCRLPYNLVDADGSIIQHNRHLLSMKDLNLSDNLEELILAGASSLKIEGRLKDVSYVKNVTAYYRQKLDKILMKYPELERASSGHSDYTFEPDLQKSFNRGFTQYFFNGRAAKDIWSLDTPKSVGEPIGKITEITTQFIKINTTQKLTNGDGLCFFNNKKELEGASVNKVLEDRIYLSNIPNVIKGTFVYRNYSHEFEKLLTKESAVRKLDIKIYVSEIFDGFHFMVDDEDGYSTQFDIKIEKEVARNDQAILIRNNLSKTGNTIFQVSDIQIDFEDNWFIPASIVSDVRRKLTDNLLSKRMLGYVQDVVKHHPTSHAFPVTNLTYLGNVMNEKSKQFYIQHQTTVLQPAFEIEAVEKAALMFTRHCVKYSLGWCPQDGADKHPFKEPFYLSYNDTKLRLLFDCKNCEMKIYKVDN